MAVVDAMAPQLAEDQHISVPVKDEFARPGARHVTVGASAVSMRPAEPFQEFNSVRWDAESIFTV